MLNRPWQLASFFLILALGFFCVSTPAVLACSCFDAGGQAVSVDGDVACQQACGDDPAAVEFGDGMCDCGESESSYALDCSALCTEAGYTRQDPNALPTPPSDVSTFATPQLNVDIPGLTFSEVVVGEGTISSNFIGEYVAALYTYLIGVASVIAIVFLMIGGVQYVLAGGTGDTAKAKARIQGAVTGLVLLLFTYTILATVNPELVFFEPLTIQMIDPVENIRLSGEAQSFAPLNVDAAALQKLGVDCKQSFDVAKVAESFVGKVAYRLGGKGNPPPYPWDTKKDPDGVSYSTYCPEGNTCLDCSGFVATVAECAGLSSLNEAGGTAAIFANAPFISNCSGSSFWADGLQITPKPGDLLGFRAGDYAKAPGFGHVWMYIGNGKVIESTGIGRSAGMAVQVRDLSWACKNYPLRFAERP